ncbi:MAG TPA: LLM class flavin-dependent oxidoreductase [Stellaceae bacterium]|nr:LLM class flavin-dependent oxidoreductase [Stellaceae bacterium]
MHTDRANEKMKLGGFFHPTGNHVAAWMHPGAQIDAGVNFKHYAEITQLAERGKFDLMFVADAVAIREGKLKALSRWPQYMAYFDPLTLLPALAAVTSHIGVVGTVTTSYNEPYHVARKFASLDLISQGRAGWNVVTSSATNEAYNFGRDAHYGHSERYDRANEFVEVVQGLWDSWDDDAFVRDRETGVYFDPAKLHALNHEGKHFKVRGPLNVARPPQGHPVIFQAGSSEAGRDSAARFAEGVFTPQHTLEGAQEFYRDLKGRMAKYGRKPESLKVMPGLNAIVGRTRKDAEETHRYLQSKIHPDVGLQLLSSQLDNMDLSEYDLDGPLPEIADDVGKLAGQTSMRNIVRWSKEEGLTIRQIYQRFAGARGQRTLIGTAVDIVDDMEKWFRGYGVDGFLVHPPYLPGGLNDFVNLVVPELQNRGLFREDYEGTTLRENLGLERPKSRYARD